MAGPDSIRTVITGVGVVSPIGIGRDAFWSGLMSGHSGLDFLKSFSSHDLPSCLAAEITDFDPVKYLRDRKFLKVMSRDVQLGVSSANLAIASNRGMG